MTQEEFKNKFPVGSIISFIGGVQFSKAQAREFFRIDEYVVNQFNNRLEMKGVWCGFEFYTDNYKKEYSTNNLERWHCIDCNDDVMQMTVDMLCHKFNDVRLANDEEILIFKHCIEKLKDK